MLARKRRGAHAKASTPNNPLVIGLVLIVLALAIFANSGQIAQKAYQDGLSKGEANASVQAYERGYEQGYASAEYDLGG